jgi:uncharacterized protein YjbI with pentapeptide repeats
VSRARLRHVRFADVKLDGIDMRLTRAEHLAFTGCTMNDVDFYEATLDQVTVDGCDLRNAHFAGARAHDLMLRGCNLEGLRGASSLRGATVSSDQVLPVALSLFAEVGISIELDTDSP